jgi:hypothetical protein
LDENGVSFSYPSMGHDIRMNPNAKKSYIVCVNAAVPKPSLRYSKPNRKPAPVAQ